MVADIDFINLGGYVCLAQYFNMYMSVLVT